MSEKFLPHQILNTVENLRHTESRESFEVENPYLTGPLLSEDELEGDFETIPTPTSRYGGFHFVRETRAGMKYVEKYPEESKDGIYQKIHESPDYVNEFFESNLIKYALAKGILNKDKIVVPSIKLEKGSEDAYFSEFIPNIVNGLEGGDSTNALSLINGMSAESIESLSYEEYSVLEKQYSKNLATFWDEIRKKENAIPLALVHLIAGDFDRNVSNYGFQVEKNGDSLAFKAVILDMAGGWGKHRNSKGHIGYSLLSRFSKDEIMQCWESIKDNFTVALVDKIFSKIPFENDLVDKKKKEIIENIKNIDKLVDEELNSVELRGGEDSVVGEVETEDVVTGEQEKYRIISHTDATLIKQRMKEIFEIINKNNVEGVIFLDKSARPLSWAYSKIARATIEKDEQPDIKFINIGGEKNWLDKISNGKVAANIETMPEYDLLKKQWANLKGKNVLLIDEFVNTGDSLRYAQQILTSLIEPANIYIKYIDKVDDSIDNMTDFSAKGLSWRSGTSDAYEGMTGVMDKFTNQRRRDYWLLAEPNTQKFRNENNTKFDTALKGQEKRAIAMNDREYSSEISRIRKERNKHAELQKILVKNERYSKFLRDDMRKVAEQVIAELKYK